MGRPALLAPEKVLDAIVKYEAKHRYPPTIEELRQRLRVGSTRTVLRYLRKLEDMKKIERWPGARGMRLLPPSLRSPWCP